MAKEIYNYFICLDPLNCEIKKTLCGYPFLKVNRIVWWMKEGWFRNQVVSTVF